MPVIINKKVGETPLEALERLRLEKPEYKTERLSYAGRLDPMAEGLLLVLVGSDCDAKNREKFLNLEKEYEVEILFGVGTDSYDLLGILDIKRNFNKNLLEFNLDGIKLRVREIIKDFMGTSNVLSYPPFSSKTINGKSMFNLALAGDLDEENLPKSPGGIQNIEIIDSKIADSAEVMLAIKSRVSKVKGNFRQAEILQKWSDFFSNAENHPVKWPILSLKVECDSGVYMRSLAKEMGDRMGIPALAYSIKRIKIGDYAL